ncbi:MAG: type II toxin-antitoxin system RelE/ParE family toxin [Pseudomonadota bacterium]
MRIAFTKPFKKDYQGLPGHIQQKIDEQIERLLDNPKHPSLRMKKMEGRPSIWEARITGGYRLTLQINGDIYLLRRVGTHDILKRP